jgi:hypothetical protein
VRNNALRLWVGLRKSRALSVWIRWTRRRTRSPAPRYEHSCRCRCRCGYTVAVDVDVGIADPDPARVPVHLPSSHLALPPCTKRSLLLNASNSLDSLSPRPSLLFHSFFSSPNLPLLCLPLVSLLSSPLPRLGVRHFSRACRSTFLTIAYSSATRKRQRLCVRAAVRSYLIRTLTVSIRR